MLVFDNCIFDYSSLRPDLSGALFASKKAGTEGGKCRPNKRNDYIQSKPSF